MTKEQIIERLKRAKWIYDMTDEEFAEFQKNYTVPINKNDWQGIKNLKLALIIANVEIILEDEK